MSEKDAKRPRSKLEDFVAARTANATADALGVGVFSIYHYLRGTRHMRPKRRQKLIAFAAGELTQDDIDVHYLMCTGRRAEELIRP